jgi:hypothetical protein
MDLDTLGAAQIAREGCQWIGPEQDPSRGPVKMCGCKPLWPGRSYCEEHVWRVYQKGTGIGTKRKNKAIEKEINEIRELEQREADDVELELE